MFCMWISRDLDYERARNADLSASMNRPLPDPYRADQVGLDQVQARDDLLEGSPWAASFPGSHPALMKSWMRDWHPSYSLGFWSDGVQWNPSIGTPWELGEVSCIERCPHFRVLRKHVWDIHVAKCP